LIQCGNAFQDAFGLGSVMENATIFDTKDWVLHQLYEEEDEEEPVNDGVERWSHIRARVGYEALSDKLKLELVRGFLQRRRLQTPLLALTEMQLNLFIDSEFSLNENHGIFYMNLGMKRKKNRSKKRTTRSKVMSKRTKRNSKW